MIDGFQKVYLTEQEFQAECEKIPHIRRFTKTTISQPNVFDIMENFSILGDNTVVQRKIFILKKKQGKKGQKLK